MRARASLFVRRLSQGFARRTFRAADVRQATAEATKEDKNLIEICFRVGNLYQSARRELEEAEASKAAADPLAAPPDRRREVAA